MGSALRIASLLTTLLCAFLLLRAYANVRRKLLLWSGLCFVILTLTNFLVIADLMIFPDIDLYTYRLGTTAVAMTVLLYGLIWESE